jgi:hypothetical protein
MDLLKNISKSRNFIRDIITLSLIVTIPFLFFTYRIIPYDSKIWYSEFLSFDLIALKDLDYIIWIIYSKILTLSVLSIWFITCGYNWRYALLFPITIEIYKIFLALLFLKSGHYYGIEYLESLIFSLPYIMVLFYVAKKVGFLNKSRKSNIINEEINKLSKFDAKHYKYVKTELVKLYDGKNKMDKKEYLVALIALRDQLNSIN